MLRDIITKKNRGKIRKELYDIEKKKRHISSKRKNI